MKSERIKGGILPYALMVSFLLLISAMLISSGSLRMLSLAGRYLRERQVIMNVDSGLELMRHSRQAQGFRNWELLPLYEGDSVRILSRPWGGLRIIGAKVSGSWKEWQKIVLAAGLAGARNGPALIMCNNGISLSISDETLLQGRLMIPGAELLNHFGQHADRHGLVLLPAPDSLPEPFADLYLIHRNNLDSLYPDLLRVAGVPVPGDSISRSFAASPLIFHSAESIILDRVELSGHIIVQSGQSIRVKRSSRLRNCLLVAPTIIIEPWFEGSLQAIASDTIIMGDKSILHQPSGLGLYRDAGSRTGGLQHIGRDSRIEGSLIFIPDGEASRETRFIIEEGSEIEGLIYSGIPLEFSGQCDGLLTCVSFRDYENGACFLNRLGACSIKGGRGTISGFGIPGDGPVTLVTVGRIW